MLAGKPSDGQAKARTLLEQMLWGEDHTLEEMAVKFERTALEIGERATITSRHLSRLASGQRSGTTPATRRVIQAMFGHSIDELLAAPADHGQSVVSALPVNDGLTALDRKMVSMAAKRARDFHLGASGSNLSGEIMDQLHDDVAMLAVAYQKQPLSQFLPQLTETQNNLFTLLEGRQPPAYTRHLFLLAGVTSGLLAKVSHDFGDSHAALTQSRTAFLCADNSDHNGLRAWIRGLQSLIAYWAGRQNESLRYAQLGAQYASQNTSSVWLPASEARAWAALGNAPAAKDALHRAEDARDSAQIDDLDELGGFCTFSHTRQIYYGAEALVWLPSEAREAQRYALDALDGYSDPTSTEWGFGDAAGAATDLAVARISLGEIEGAADALQSVLALPPQQRIHGVVLSVDHAYSALAHKSADSSVARDLQEQIEIFKAMPISAIGKQ